MAETPFLWGRGGRKLTPDQVEREREAASLLAKGAMDYSPVQHWSQGLGRVAQGLLAGIDYRMADKADADIANVNKGLIANLLSGGSGATSPASSSAIPMTGAAGEIAATAPGSAVGGAGPEAYRNAIASIESAGSGDYSAVGPTNDKLGRALGRYQIMEANIGPWSQEALGRAVTPEEFLADPALQDAIFDAKFGQYVNQFGPEGAAQAWFAGPGGVGKTGRKDILGTTVGEYGQRFTSALGGTPASAAIESVSPTGAQAEISATSPVAAAIGAAPVEVAGGGDRVPMAPASTVINPAIIEALTNPQASEQTQRIAGILLEQEQARQKAALDRSKPIEVNGRIINPMTGQVIADYSDPKTATVGNSVIDLRTGKPIYEGPQEPKTATVGNTVVDVRTGQPVYQGQPEATTGMREYDAYAADEKAAGRTPIGRLEYEQAIRKAGANSTTNIVGGEGDKFYENLDKKNAEMFSALSDEGVRGRGKLAQINRLQGLLSAAPQGGLAALKQAAGEYGINTEGLSDIQSAQALINELVPQQRQPGSGPMSDADLALFKQSLPRIINQPGGNETIVNTMRGITEYQVRMGEIADAVADRSMTPTQGREAIRNLKNPLDDYTKLIRGIENDEQDQGWREISPGVRVRKID